MSSVGVVTYSLKLCVRHMQVPSIYLQLSTALKRSYARCCNLKSENECLEGFYRITKVHTV